CKYSQSGTRLYIDVQREADTAVISFKNISRDRLNVSVDELIERFVRGDSSRTTEGSGLGLNIARSLVELQNGTFRLSIDGDLFKAEVCLPVIP
ncbi:MAG TPA: sensor histidine kinase, partial [Ruminiclostridium sp.]|nr:sensor histidine kinase [Ruminiclostridium sp.]